jgi:hypothetical protein
VYETTVRFLALWLMLAFLLPGVLDTTGVRVSKMMQQIAVRPTKRRMTKTSLAVPAQEPLPEAPELGDEGTKDHKRSVYLVTLPHPRSETSTDGIRLVAPESLLKKQVLECFLDSCARPCYIDAQAQAQGCMVHVAKTGVFREYHLIQADGDGVAHAHDHLPLVAEAGRSFRFLPVKRALLLRHGLASHWSCTHVGYWSAIGYCVVATPKKPLKSLDACPVLWASAGGHPPVDTCCHEPMTAAASLARRWKASQQAAEEGSAEPRVTELDVWAMVVRAGIRNTDDDHTAHQQLAQYAKSHCSGAMRAWLFKNRAKLPGLIDDIWQWECVEGILAETRRGRVEALQDAAESPCICADTWPKHVVKVMTANGISITELCHDVHYALTNGRGETTPVVVLAGAAGGEGKSFFLKPLLQIFSGKGLVFPRPEKGNFPSLDLEQAKVCLLDDWRFDATVLSFAAQCLWYDGSGVPIVRLQNVPGQSGHLLYKGSAPICATTGLDRLQALAHLASVDPSTGKPTGSNASMIMRRLKVYSFRVGVGKPQPPSGHNKVPYCARCFSRMVLGQEA